MPDPDSTRHEQARADCHVTDEAEVLFEALRGIFESVNGRFSGSLSEIFFEILQGTPGAFVR